MSKLLIVGSNGMAGHVITRYLKQQNHDVITVARTQPCNYKFDVLHDNIFNIIEDVQPEFVINCIGMLVKDSIDNPQKAKQVNGIFPHTLAAGSKLFNYKLIHISTDCVFSGKTGNYNEASVKDETNMYGYTKNIGEVNDDHNLTIRTSIIGPEVKSNGTGLLHWFTTQSEERVNGFCNAYWNGITTFELAKFINSVLNTDITSLVHIHSKQRVSKYQLLNLFKQYYNVGTIVEEFHNEELIDKTIIRTRVDFDYDEITIEDQIKELVEWY